MQSFVPRFLWSSNFSTRTYKRLHNVESTLLHFVQNCSTEKVLQMMTTLVVWCCHRTCISTCDLTIYKGHLQLIYSCWIDAPQRIHVYHFCFYLQERNLNSLWCIPDEYAAPIHQIQRLNWWCPQNLCLISEPHIRTWISDEEYLLSLLSPLKLFFPTR